MIIAIIIISILALITLLWYLFPLIEVVGKSMFPTYKNGEIILATRIYLKSKLKVGDVIVFKSPTDGKIVIKRISEIRGKHTWFFCEGDNTNYSYDSRHYGFIFHNTIICKIVRPRANKRIQSEGGSNDE